MTVLKQMLAQRRLPLCMGVLNITPDSFHDGGRYLAADDAVRHMRQLAASGADIIDIGGMSSRPGYTPVSEHEEQSRILPVIRRCATLGVPLSVDTDRWSVAEAAVAAGVTLINDCSGREDSPLMQLAARHQLPIVLMHRAGVEGRHTDITTEVLEFFRVAMENGRRQGLSDSQFILDPGLGFNKSVDENLTLLRELPRLRELDCPLLIGYSHKRFAAALSGEQPGSAPGGNAALAAYCWQHGVEIVRVHEPQSFVPLVRACAALSAGEVVEDR